MTFINTSLDDFSWAFSPLMILLLWRVSYIYLYTVKVLGIVLIVLIEEICSSNLKRKLFRLQSEGKFMKCLLH